MNTTRITTLIFWLIAILLIAGAAYVFSVRWMPSMLPAAPQAPSLADEIRTGTAPIPALTADVKTKLAAGHGFQALVSYTDGGFESARVTIKIGQTVRFTNNSSRNVWIAADGTNMPIYPKTMSVCGSSDLDSCGAIAPMDFFEFTFAVKGEWDVVNNLDKSKRLVVTVQ